MNHEKLPLRLLFGVLDWMLGQKTRTRAALATMLACAIYFAVPTVLLVLMGVIALASDHILVAGLLELLAELCLLAGFVVTWVGGLFVWFYHHELRPEIPIPPVGRIRRRISR